ncbi:helix-turn-helix domain-containing protein [Actinoplanes sp. NPDC051633]|uniref:helix-turn-helix domain-containing protein n=1 Tax=Actinoplanes sp. NPDC051633 TaxID=3155670 RepID=UPI003417C6B2
MSVNEHVQAKPSPALRPYVAGYSGYRQKAAAGTVHRGLPSPYLTLILTLDEPLVILAHPDRRQAPGSYDTLLGGLHLRPALIRNGAAQSGIQVTVLPLGCRALFGMPAGELGHLDVDCAQVLGDRVTQRLRAAIRAESSWPRRFAALDAALAGLIDHDRRVHPDVGYAFDRVLDSGGTVTARQLAAEVGWSDRHLTNRFRAETGLGLKEAARVTRFDRARRRLRPGARLADIAAATGYYDQAHLAREFTALAGVTATRWLADEFDFVQARAASAEDAY